MIEKPHSIRSEGNPRAEMRDNKRYLLLLGCSQTKRHTSGLIPAIERYDGVNYRVLAKARREGRIPTALDVLILSAEHGLIPAGKPIADYERRMTGSRADALRSNVSALLEQILSRTSYREVFVNMGMTYRRALDEGIVREHAPILRIASGGIGMKMSAMRQWLATVGRRD